MSQELNTFLVRAKRATYAAGMAPSAPSRPHSKDLHFAEGPWRYIDTYLGDVNFIGEEAVWKEDTAVWGMNYYGWMLVDTIPGGFSDCLKGALNSLPVETPYRGPVEFHLNEFTYRCHWEGTPECFRGEESISQNDQVIYRLYFHGGQITYFHAG